MRNSGGRSVVLVVAVLSFVLGCSTAPPPTTAPAVAAPTPAPGVGGENAIKIGLVAGTGATPVYVAAGRGYYQQQGLDVQFVTVSSGPSYCR